MQVASDSAAGNEGVAQRCCVRDGRGVDAVEVLQVVADVGEAVSLCGDGADVWRVTGGSDGRRRLAVGGRNLRRHIGAHGKRDIEAGLLAVGRSEHGC